MSYDKYYNQAEEYYVNGKYEQALKLFNQALNIKETNDCLNYIGCCYLQLNKLTLAIEVFEKIGRISPDWERPFINLGRAYIKLDEQQKALICFKRALELNPNNEDAYFYLGVYYFKKQDYISAKSYYEQSLHLDETQSEAYLNLGLCYFNLDIFDKAIESFNSAYKYDDTCIDAIYNKGLVLLEMKNYMEALNHFLIVYKNNPCDIQNMLDIAYCFHRMDKFEDVCIWAIKILTIEPQNKIANRLLRNSCVRNSETVDDK